MKNLNFFKNKTVLITGATSGIGRDLALVLGNVCTLILIGRRRERLESLHQTIKNKSLIFVGSVTDSVFMEGLAHELLQKNLLPDIIIANAGVGGLNPGDTFSKEIDFKILSTNYFGSVNTFAPFLPSLIKRRSGQIVFISSLAGLRGLPNASSYSASKAAQRVLAESLRLDLRRFNIQVNSILPGFVDSEMTEHNEFYMPFKMKVRDSSYLVLDAIAKNKSIYLYPWQMKILSYLNLLLPNFIYDRLVPFLAKSYKKDLSPKIF